MDADLHQVEAWPNDKPRISRFPQGPTMWRVDWFGVVEFVNRQQRSGQPSILVHLSRVTDNDALTSSHVLLRPESTAFRYQRKCWVSLGQLTLLRIGDLWQDQVLVASPQYQEAVFEDVQVTAASTELVPAGVSLEPGVFLLPLAEHPWHIGNTQSFCVKVRLADGRQMVIPCLELIRFYFGSSSTLLARLFVPPVAKSNLFTSVKTHPETGIMNLCLAQGMPLASKEDVARIAGCRDAWYAVKRIAASLQSADAHRSDPYPQFLFPFQGTTTLKASGKWVSRGEKAEQTFVVFHLNSCSHPFPYNKLFVTQAGATGDLDRPTASRRGHANRFPTTNTPKSPDSPRLVDQNPSSALCPTELKVPRRRHFTDLENKPTRKGHRFAYKQRDPTGGSGALQIPNLADGAPIGSVNRVRSVELVEASKSAKDSPPPSFLKPIISALESIEEISGMLLTGSDEDGWSVPLRLLFDEDGVIASELLVNRRDGHVAPRRAAAFRLEHQGAALALVVIEDSHFIPLLYPLGQGHIDDPWPYVEQATKDYSESASSNANRSNYILLENVECASRDIAEWIAQSFMISSKLPPVVQPRTGVSLIIDWFKQRLPSLFRAHN